MVSPRSRAHPASRAPAPSHWASSTARFAQGAGPGGGWGWEPKQALTKPFIRCYEVQEKNTLSSGHATARLHPIPKSCLRRKSRKQQNTFILVVHGKGGRPTSCNNKNHEALGSTCCPVSENRGPEGERIKDGFHQRSDQVANRINHIAATCAIVLREPLLGKCLETKGKPPLWSFGGGHLF